MARPFMFAALCQRAHPLKHSLAESIFVIRVQKRAKKILVSRKIRQQGHSLAEVSLNLQSVIDWWYNKGDKKNGLIFTSPLVFSTHSGDDTPQTHNMNTFLMYSAAVLLSFEITVSHSGYKIKSSLSLLRPDLELSLRPGFAQTRRCGRSNLDRNTGHFDEIFRGVSVPPAVSGFYSKRGHDRLRLDFLFFQLLLNKSPYFRRQSEDGVRDGTHNRFDGELIPDAVI